MNKKSPPLLKTYLFLPLSLFFISCRQTVVICEEVLIDEPTTEENLVDFIQTSILNWFFFLWLIIFSLVAIFLWKNGYSVLKWFKGKPFSSKVVIAFFVLATLYAIGCVPQNNYGGWFAIPIIAVFYSAFIVIKSIVNRFKFRIKEKNEKSPLPESVRHQRNLRLLGKIMVWVWSCGWLLHFLAIGIARKPHVGAEVLWRSAIASLNLFLTSVDSTIIVDIQGHDILKGLISCVGISAVLCTVLLILNLVIYRLRAYLHIRHLSISNERNHLYLFFGINDASMLLEQDIYKEDPQSVIVFVDSSQNSKSEQEEDKVDGWKHIVNLFTHRRKALIDAHEDDRRGLAISNCDICSLEDFTHDVLGNIGIEQVKRLVENLKNVNDAQLHVFFLSEDREINVRSTVILAQDDLIGSKDFQTTIYCHARRNTVNRVIEDLGLASERKIDVKILDSSHLAIEQLKRDVKNHPVSYVSVDKLDGKNPGSVTSEFFSLVIGFGETGQEAVEFLYEYGAFVDKTATQYDSKRSPFCCYVLDSDMEKLEGHFVSGIPAVKCKRCKERDSENTNNNKTWIKLYPFDYRSDEFFKILNRITKKLNYVVVAIGDDEQNMTAAVEILRYVRKKRGNLDNFCIYVRAYEKGSFKHLSQIANHYNKRLAKNDNDDVEKIVLFGQNELIYTYELVVKDKYSVDGQNYYETYRSLQIDPRNDEGSWEKRRKDTLNDCKRTKWERLSKIRRKESQDRSNALHAQTKLLLLQKTIGEDNAKSLALRVLEERTGKQISITYPLLSPSENRLMLNLAMCEHLRWNAAHEMMGYVNNIKGHGCDELIKEHNCLKHWQDLDNESDNANYPVDFKLFDFGVVETSFKREFVDNKEQPKY
jgi:hypothetical protein